MKSLYDKYYLEEDLFGPPYKELVHFFKNRESKGTVLDLGCGQGRDLIPLAKMGYTVHGIDNSLIGLKQLKDKTKSHDYNITLECRDIYEVDMSLNYDIVLLDSMFHFYKKDTDKEAAFLTRILRGTKKGSIIAIFMQKGKRREAILKQLINDHIIYEIQVDQYIDYETHLKIQYLMYIVKKIDNI